MLFPPKKWGEILRKWKKLSKLNLDLEAVLLGVGLGVFVLSILYTGGWVTPNQTIGLVVLENSYIWLHKNAPNLL